MTDTSAPHARDLETGDLETLDTLIAQQEKLLVSRMTRSFELRETARETLAGGVASSWQDSVPGAIWIEYGRGQMIRDADGNDYVDMHGGFGVGLAGHGHPAIVEAVARRARLGTHFGQPTEDLIVVSRLLRERFGLPVWRFGNSGTEATMDAVHLMRVATGRKKIIKVEGSYHGHHDSVQVSTYSAEGDIGPDDAPRSVAFGPAYPSEVVDLTIVVPFGDLEAVRRVLEAHPGEIAGMIIEPIMMNIGMITAEPGYHAALKELLHAHGAYLTYDEVKTGLAVAPGGATELYGVLPDIVCLAKAMGGGVPCGAIGATAELMELIADNIYQQVGTFNGNPLTMAAVRAMLTEVLTPDAYAHLDAMRAHMADGVTELMARYDIPGYVASAGAKGSVIFTDQLRNYRDFLKYADQWGHAHWLYQVNGGIFLPPWGKTEQFTLSVQHTMEDARRFVGNFESLCRAVRGGAR
ncbi:aspartate aminotransferase family protein [Microtetraspora niveoalba]|uniref:aspartate aminotransferase family protein n=1 Tax=Microtetraspora niveoalba TaxID=46175 RepID=UPI00082EBFF5|nr:aminotransferase class III-fold pyridoxal phosphate-dependent enzyme [Microtetraspora niveoalba]